MPSLEPQTVEKRHSLSRLQRKNMTERKLADNNIRFIDLLNLEYKSRPDNTAVKNIEVLDIINYMILKMILLTNKFGSADFIDYTILSVNFQRRIQYSIFKYSTFNQ